MVAATRPKTRPYYGGPGTVEQAVAASRVWHSVESKDAADLIYQHLTGVLSSQEEETNKSLPDILCLAYQ